MPFSTPGNLSLLNGRVNRSLCACYSAVSCSPRSIRFETFFLTESPGAEPLDLSGVGVLICGSSTCLGPFDIGRFGKELFWHRLRYTLRWMMDFLSMVPSAAKPWLY
jgi:hypothetical protein